MILILTILSTIPFIDKNVSKYIRSFNYQKYTQIISDKIIYFNIFINLLYLYITGNHVKLLIRYFIEFFIINFFFKCLLDRPRPIQSNFKYYSIFDIKLSKVWKNHQSFPSGHVATIYLTYNIMFDNYFKMIYLFLVFLTAISRINLGAHYFSDCIFAIFICDISLLILK